MFSNSAQPIRLMLVESHPFLRECIHRLLDEDDSFSIIAECASGLQAVGEAMRLQPDVILTDLRLDDSNGLALARMVTRLTPSTPVVLMISHELGRNLEMECGISEVVSKSALCTNLVATLHRAGGMRNTSPGTVLTNKSRP